MCVCVCVCAYVCVRKSDISVCACQMCLCVCSEERWSFPSIYMCMVYSQQKWFLFKGVCGVAGISPVY